MIVSLTVNGTPRTVDVPPHRTLLRLLREELGLTGTKECCAEGECGACTVLMDGMSVDACLVLGVEAEGTEITTVEGLARDGQLDAVQAAFLEHGAVQCGFCIPGMLMSAKCLLNTTSHPSSEEIKEALAGHLCRCAGYSRIIAAVAAAARAECCGRTRI